MYRGHCDLHLYLFYQFKFYEQYLTHLFFFLQCFIFSGCHSWSQFIKRCKNLICKESTLASATGGAEVTNLLYALAVFSLHLAAVLCFAVLRFIFFSNITSVAINIFLDSKKYKLLTDAGPLPVPVLLRLWLHSDLQPLSPRSNPQCVHWSTARGYVYFEVKIVLLQFED